MIGSPLKGLGDLRLADRVRLLFDVDVDVDVVVVVVVAIAV